MSCITDSYFAFWAAVKKDAINYYTLCLKKILRHFIISYTNKEQTA